MEGLEKYSGFTVTELHKMIIDIDKEYTEIKQNIIFHVDEINSHKKIIAELEEKLDTFETDYVQMMEILISKQNGETVGQ